MEKLQTTKVAIERIMVERYRDPSNFEAFSAQLMGLDIERLVFDALRNEMSFYTKNQFVCALDRLDVLEAQANNPWQLGDYLDVHALEKAINKLDSGTMTPIDFHREIFLAGVVQCHVYLMLRKIFYMGHDGQYYLEKY
jgi:uncharacterized protein YbcV (DUF1398 family)